MNTPCLTELCSQQRLPCLPCLHSFRHSSEMTVRRSFAMAGVISGGVTNVILDYVYIFIMKWGMGGAALATATGTTLTVLILASFIFSRKITT